MKLIDTNTAFLDLAIILPTDAPIMAIAGQSWWLGAGARDLHMIMPPNYEMMDPFRDYYIRVLGIELSVRIKKG